MANQEKGELYLGKYKHDELGLYIETEWGKFRPIDTLGTGVFSSRSQDNSSMPSATLVVQTPCLIEFHRSRQ